MWWGQLWSTSTRAESLLETGQNPTNPNTFQEILLGDFGVLCVVDSVGVDPVARSVGAVSDIQPKSASQTMTPNH